MELSNAMAISASGLKAQEMRVRVTAENIANAEAVSTEAGGEPYRRKVIQFSNTLDKERGVALVKVKRITTDTSDFNRKYDPSHPAADKDGYILTPNVNRFLEMQDMREAQHSYSANLSALEVSRGMLKDTINMIGGN
jgi:flagellar basal-body rod protein FlgC